MDEVVTTAEANRSFSRILRNVRNGRSYVVTSHGQPVARIVPAHSQESVRSDARAALLSRLRNQAMVEAGAWTRDELYEEEE